MKIRVSKNFGKRIAAIGLTAMMASTFIAGQAFSFRRGSGITASADEYSLDFENANGRFDLTDVRLSNLNSQTMQNTISADVKNTTRTVIVTLDADSLPSRGEATNSERKQVEMRQEQFLTDLRKEGIKYNLVSRYYSIFNGVAISVKLSELTKIKAIDGVRTVTVGSTYERPKAIETFEGATKNASNIYETGIYNSSAYLNKADGSGMTVAILDTGLDYTHEAFSPDNLESTDIAYSKERVASLMAPGHFKATVRTGATVEDVYINAKVPFAYDYADSDADVYPSYNQHGTHVAGIVAGKGDSYTNKDGYTAVDGEGNEIPFRGVAPEAQLVICKVFTDNLESDSIGGAEATSILDALEDCYNLNVDVINMSLGTSCGFSSKSLGLTDEDEEGHLMKEVYSKIREKGITMMVAASNDYSSGYGSAFGTNLASNPDSATVGSPSTYLGSMSVGSVNGQLASYMLANPTVDANGVIKGGEAVYYEESRNEDSDAYNFIDDILGSDPTEPGYKTKGKIKYVAVDGNGAAGDYTSNIRRELSQKEGYDAVVVLIKRGMTSFKDKIEVAKDNGADGVIVYNNVSGMIRMSLGDLEERIPAISVSMEIGLKLRKAVNSSKTGEIYIDRSYLAGPFMNEYSSWGPSPDLQLKPDVTSHGGEITSTVAGGFDEMSGTSMACPNLAGFTALLKSYLKENLTNLWNAGEHTEYALTSLANNMMMSTATVVYDQNGLPYSPRKQGAGLATMANVFSTKAYLYTKDTYNYEKHTYDTTDPEYMCEDGRPKAELGDDPKKTGEYNVVFYVKNFDSNTMSFTTNSIIMTETLGADGKSVAEKAHLFGNDATWKVNGVPVNEGAGFSVPAGGDAKIEVNIKLTNDEKKYLDDNFKNGMFVEGFLQLKGSDGQCDLSLPFLAFYGDWRAADMLDLSCFDIAKDAKDTSLKDEERAQPRVFATQPYGLYWNEKYVIPLGSYVYNQDENLEHTADYVYTEMEHIAVSRFNEYFGEGSSENYMTSTGFKALYTGLLRNAEIVTYRLTNEDTGEVILTKEIYRVGKAYANGGSSIPANVQLDLRTYELGLKSNGKYRMDFDFYAYYDDYKNGEVTDDTFQFSFYVDYEAPILVDSRIRFQDRKDENNRDIKKVYLDLDIFDNHYPQAVLLCYIPQGGNTLRLATEYATPILNPLRNTTTTVSIDITDIYEDYKGNLYVEIDDYAMNNNVYEIMLDHSKTNTICPTDFNVTLNGQVVTEITVPLNTAVKLGIDKLGNANISNFKWDISGNYAKVENGEVFGSSTGTETLYVYGGVDENGKQTIKQVVVHVVDSQATLGRPTIAFGTILNADGAVELAKGMVTVAPEQRFTLKVNPTPWYYPVKDLQLKWTTSDPELATVDQSGNVQVMYEGDKVKNVTITATSTVPGYENVSASVILAIRDPYVITNGILTKYQGLGGELKDNVVIGGKTYNNVRVLTIPNDRSITQIGTEAFKENENVDVVIIPKNVSTISERAFLDCTSLRKICFISEEKKVPADSSLFMIERNAFQGCTSLETVDLGNCKVITLDLYVFSGCESLKEVKDMTNVGTMGNGTFAGCTSLTSVDISKLHVAGNGIFAGCTALSEVITSADTALGANMFNGCTALTSIEINCSNIADGAFEGCSMLNTVNIKTDIASIGRKAFKDCYSLENFNLSDGGKTYKISNIGDEAFSGCSYMNNILEGLSPVPELGKNVFNGVVSVTNAYKTGEVLYLAPKTINGAGELSTVLDGVKEIAPYAFSGTTLTNVTQVDLSSIEKLGEGAFCNVKGLTSVILPDVKEIGNFTFRGTSLTSVEIPASVEVIGSHAFSGITTLTQLSFAQNAKIKEIKSNAFDGCGITELTLPAGVKTIGNEAFASNKSLVTANISAVTDMGIGAFAFCPALTTVTFADGASDAGRYTFFGGDEKFGSLTFGDFVLRSYEVDTYIVYKENENGINELEGYHTASSLTSVTLPESITRIGEGVFAYCDKLASIDLNKVTELYGEIVHTDKYTVDNYTYGKGTELVGSAFFACESLVTVTGLDKVATIGPNTFAHCIALKAANLTAAESVGYTAFFDCNELATVTFGDKLEGIGDEAFAETAIETVTIPVNCSYVGASAFSGGKGMRSYSVAAGSKYFFTDEKGVLYSYTEAAKDVYKLVAYPSRAVATQMTYTVKEGTVTICDYAFYLVPATSVTKVIIPHTVKSIGEGAFFMCDINTYCFEGVTAPTLLQGLSPRVIPRGQISQNSFYYNNFAGYLAYMVAHFPGDTVEYMKSTLTIEYPSNGKGYDNFVYSGYFGTKTVTAEACEETTYEFIALIKSLPDPSTVSGMTNRDEVVALHAKVKEAHRLYNIFSRSQAQLVFAGNDNVEKLFALERELKPLKQKFNIPVKISTIAVDASSTHKSAYREGEKFSVKGLKFLVTYDDYSQEIIDASPAFTVEERFNNGLKVTDSAVSLSGSGEYEGWTVYVPVTVTQGAAATGLPTVAIVLIVVGVVAVLAVGALVTLLVLSKKGVVNFKSSKTAAATEEEATADDTSDGDAAAEDVAGESADKAPETEEKSPETEKKEQAPEEKGENSDKEDK